LTWLRVWNRAVIRPASRRVQGVWTGAVIGGGMVFGPTGMHPHDLTELAWRVPLVGLALAVTWLLLFVPTARVLVRAEGARYLRALPGPRVSPIAAAIAVFALLQGPWLALWLIGDGARGAVVVTALSIVIAAVAWWQPAPLRTRAPAWRDASSGLRGVYVRALRRRAADALVRGGGLAILAGLVAGLVVRNNSLAGWPAARIGATAIAIVLVPGWAGALLPLLDAHRTSAWLAAALGVPEAARRGVLATCVAAIYVMGALLAALAAGLLVDGKTFAWLVPTCAVAALATSLVATRLLLWAERSEAARSLRVVVAAIVASAACVIALVGLL